MRNWIAPIGCAALLTLGAGAVSPPTAVAVSEGSVLGPPAICVEIACEGDVGIELRGERGRSKSLSAADATEGALKALASNRDILTHMETIRRATLHLHEDPGWCNALLAQLLARAAAAEAEGASAEDRALAWFDAGYFAGALSHMGVPIGWKPGYAQNVAGLAWLERAVEVGDQDAAMHFAAAIVAHPAMRQSKRDLYERHLRAALAGAGEGTTLLTNIEAHLAHWDEPIAEFRTAG